MRKILQVFKRKRKAPKPQLKVYICDPERNRKCDKTGCWYIGKRGPCKCTLKKKYAKRDANGDPVIATDNDILSIDWLEEKIFEASRDEGKQKENF